MEVLISGLPIGLGFWSIILGARPWYPIGCPIFIVRSSSLGLPQHLPITRQWSNGRTILANYTGTDFLRQTQAAG